MTETIKAPDHNAPASDRDTDNVTPREHDMTNPDDRSIEQVERQGQPERSDETRPPITPPVTNPEPTDGGAPDDPKSAQTNVSPPQRAPAVKPRPGMAVKYNDGERLIAATIRSIDETAPDTGVLASYRVDLNLWRTNDDPLWHQGRDTVLAVDYGDVANTWTEAT